MCMHSIQFAHTLRGSVSLEASAKLPSVPLTSATEKANKMSPAECSNLLDTTGEVRYDPINNLSQASLIA